MTDGEQKQRAGESSVQSQAGRDINVYVNPGAPTEERVREIVEEFQAKSLRDEYSEEGQVLGRYRIEAFNDRLIVHLSETNLLDAFADPGFQVLVKKAQLGAATTERESDYDLIVRLLEARAVQGEDRKLRSADRTIEIIDKVDDSALTGLTVLHLLQTTKPLQPEPDGGLGALDRLLHDLLSHPLPYGQEWLEHLEILDAISISQVSNFPPFGEFLSKKLDGYAAKGVEANSEKHKSALGAMQAIGVRLPEQEHELKPGFIRLSFVDVAQLETSLAQADEIDEETSEQLIRIAKDTYGLGQADRQTREGLEAMANQYSTLAAVGEWWGQIPTFFNPTAVGRRLAVANAKLCSDLVPDFE